MNQFPILVSSAIALEFSNTLPVYGTYHNVFITPAGLLKKVAPVLKLKSTLTLYAVTARQKIQYGTACYSLHGSMAL